MYTKYLLHENWTANKNVIIHKSTCGHAIDSLKKMTDNWLRKNKH